MTNPPRVKIKHVDYAALVKKQQGEDANKKEPSYEWSNGRKFDDTGSRGGPYNQS